MKGTSTSVIMLFCFLFICGICGLSFADDAEVLPKGIFNVNLNTNFYVPVDKRFDEDGNVEDAAENFNANLNSGVFSALSDLETAFAMPAGSASVGDSVVSFKYNFTQVNVLVAYGITDKLTVGINIPYSWQKNTVKKRLDTSRATVGKSAIGNGFGAPLVPLDGDGDGVSDGGPFGDAVPLSTEDVVNLINGGLDVDGDGVVDLKGFGFKKFKTWSDHGVEDIEGGFKYQYLSTEKWKLAFSGGVRFPTGKVDDPDNLVDRGFGTGAYVLLFRLHNDFVGVKNLTLDTTFRYDLYLPDKQKLRVTDSNHPIAPEENKDNVERDLGDVIELEASASYALPKGFGVSLLYKYGHSFKDRMSGNRPDLDYNALEEETDYTEHIYIAGLSYSTIQLFSEKKFPVPLNASVSYRNRFAGTNNVLKSQYVGLGLGVYF